MAQRAKRIYNKSMKKILNINIVSWILGLVFYFSAIDYLLSIDIINTILILLIAILPFPPSFKLFKELFNKYYKIKLGDIQRLFIIITLFIIFNLSNPSTLEVEPKTTPGAKTDIIENSIENISNENTKIYNTEISTEQINSETNFISYKVDRVIDGDTIKVFINSQSETIRLIGINTPETIHPEKAVECFGLEASLKLKELLEGKNVYLEEDKTQNDRDKYNRLLRYVYRNDNLFINQWMIENGFGFEYTYEIPYIYQNEFRLAEKKAKIAKLGLWEEGVCDNFNNLITEENKKNCLIKGNISYNTKEKIYHLLECEDYSKTVINKAKGERWFCSEEEAIEAGWRIAENCHPN